MSEDIKWNLISPSEGNLYAVSQWRTDVRDSLRSSYIKTPEEQVKWYQELPDNYRFWMITGDRRNTYKVGFGGFTDINFESGNAEISLIIDPDRRRNGFGMGCVETLLQEGFGNMGLHSIYGEVYGCSPALEFWKKVAKKYNAHTTTLPCRKRWRGHYYGSMFFTILASEVLGDESKAAEDILRGVNNIGVDDDPIQGATESTRSTDASSHDYSLDDTNL